MTLEPPRRHRPAIARRSFLTAALASAGGAGVIATAWPFIDQMNPDAGVRADIISLDLVGLRPAEQTMVTWRKLPILVVRRTAGMLRAMADEVLVGRLIDPQSEKWQQPAYARNWHRSIDPNFSVLVGVCTSCGCVPSYGADRSELNVAGGYACPCCASHYDPAGRVYFGPARYNLPIPPHQMIGGSRVLIGKNVAGEIFALESVQRI